MSEKRWNRDSPVYTKSECRVTGVTSVPERIDVPPTSYVPPGILYTLGTTETGEGPNRRPVKESRNSKFINIIKQIPDGRTN